VVVVYDLEGWDELVQHHDDRRKKNDLRLLIMRRRYPDLSVAETCIWSPYCTVFHLMRCISRLRPIVVCNRSHGPYILE
jgi:hypothetical protein